MLKNLLLVACLLLALPMLTFAQNARMLMLDTIFQCGFTPTETVFFINIDGQTSVRPAIVSELQSSVGESVGESDRESVVGDYLAIVPVAVDELPQSLSTVFYAQSEDGKFCFQQLNSESLEEIEERLNYSHSLRARISAARIKQAQVIRELEQSDKELQRLRQDARIIGKLGRIAQKEAELARMQEQQSMLTQDLERLNSFLRQASEQMAPRSFARRQAELTSQLEELAKIGRLVEDSESARRQSSQYDWQSGLALLEETRYDDIVELTSQLEQLREARIRIQTSVQPSGETEPYDSRTEQQQYIPAQTPEQYLP